VNRVVALCALKLWSVVQKRWRMQTPEHAAYALHGGRISRWVASPEALAGSSRICDLRSTIIAGGRRQLNRAMREYVMLSSSGEVSSSHLALPQCLFPFFQISRAQRFSLLLMTSDTSLTVNMCFSYLSLPHWGMSYI
jgi:hypothetical protein